MSGYVSGGVAAGASWPLDNTGATAGTDAITLDVTGDTNLRFVVNHDGSMEWGPGNAVADLTLARSAANLLTLTGRLSVNAGAASQIPLIAKGFASQTANLQEWQNSAGTVVASMNATGGLTTAANDRPITLWIDGSGNSRINSSAGSMKISANGSIIMDAPIIMGDGYNIAVNTSTGTKIGTATTQKLGFFNAAPVVQPAGVADATGGATIDAEARTAINAVISKLETLGLLATV